MSTFTIEGGCRLSGEITPQGAKNEALQIISATLLTSEPVTINNIPDILDIRNLIALLTDMGVKVERHSPNNYTFQASEINSAFLDSREFVKRCASLRGSVLVVGPLLARFGKAYFPRPGGDKIGRRKVDTHITGLINLGATLEAAPDRRAYLLQTPEGERLTGTYMLLDEASVTGTANIVMAATLARGVTTIYNAACEPYLQKLCRLLVARGARICG
ncbi:MAG: UDP-N-acetylglucosamine 1-carboxyvinyltransferase, partial [Muribaculaceae bacterium]|nr:UDP-N-acetylglucosamine 1-carboxyvinyltransferase [Muribaculaceae bacterium]